MCVKICLKCLKSCLKCPTKRPAIFDGASFWIMNAKKKHLLAYAMLDKNVLMFYFMFNFPYKIINV